MKRNSIKPAGSVGRLVSLRWIKLTDGDAGVEVTAAELPTMLKSYVSSLPSPPDSWTSLGPLLGGIKSSVSDLR